MICFDCGIEFFDINKMWILDLHNIRFEECHETACEDCIYNEQEKKWLDSHDGKSDGIKDFQNILAKWQGLK